MAANSRLDTLRVIAGTNPALKNSAKLANILGELNRIMLAERRSKDDRWLLKVLHTTRALDTALSEVLTYKAWIVAGAAPSLGSYLKTLSNHGVLTTRQREDFQKSIVKKRNTYMHEAGSMPSRLEADSILSEMHHCWVLVLSNI